MSYMQANYMSCVLLLLVQCCICHGALDTKLLSFLLVRHICDVN